MLTSMAAVAANSKRSVHLNKSHSQRNHKTCPPGQAPTTCKHPLSTPTAVIASPGSRLRGKVGASVRLADSSGGVV